MRILFGVLLFACALSSAQEPPAPPPPQTPQPQQDPRPERQPGQAPEEQPAHRLETPAIEQPETPDLPPETARPQEDEEYRGPTILSRGSAASVRRSSELFRIHPFATVEGIYDTGIASVSVDDEGQIPYRDAYGVQATFGVTGSHRWRRSDLALDYRGALRHYSRESFYDGSDHALLLRWEGQASRRWIVSLTQAAATFTRGFMLPYGLTQTYSENFALLTGNEFFDTRTNALISTGQAIYQPTARLSFGMGAAGFLVRRRSEELVGANGYTAIGDMGYRLSRYSTIGFEYSFSHFDFQKQFGESDVHGFAMNYAKRIGRWWEIRLRGGAYRVETSRLQEVQLDPIVAEILGQTTGVSIFHDVTYMPQITARLTRAFRRSSFSAGYSRMISPGNGLYLTARAETTDASYTNQTSRQVAIDVGGGVTRMTGLTQALQDYRSYFGNAGVSVKVASNLAVISRFEVRTQMIPGTLIDRVAYRISVGLGWAPADYPVSVW